MSEPIAGPQSFPSGGRRAVVYAFYDRRGHVEDFVAHALEGLAAHADVFVVVNGPVSTASRERLGEHSVLVLERENSGLDIGAHSFAVKRLGARLREYDEVIFTNSTWYGPLADFGRLFAGMDARPVDFWGMTAHAPATPHPLTGRGHAPYHLQSHWIAVRARLMRADAWERYWVDLGEVSGYHDAVLRHETVFTEHFARLGYAHAAAFPLEGFRTVNPSLWEPGALIAAGCPIVKRRVFFHSPLELAEHGVIGRDTAAAMVEQGYPRRAMWTDLARNVQPKILSTNAALLEVVAPDGGAYDDRRGMRVAVAAHIFYDDMTADILDRADHLPDGYDLFVTTPDETRAARIRAVIADRAHPPRNVDVRVVASNDGRDQSAFLIGLRDVLTDGGYDLVVKLHSKKTPQDGYNIGRHFAQQQFDNLLAGRGHAANVLALFQRHPEVGIVYPPAIHVGYPTLGHGWWANRPGFERLCEELGIAVPIDDSSPLAPYGSMFIARPEALRPLLRRQWDYADFGGAQAYRDGGLAHILERMPSYAAAEAGYTTYTVLTPDYFALSHTALEFDLDQFTALVPATAAQQVALLDRAGHFGTGRYRDFARVAVRARFPGLGARLRRVLGPALAVRRRLRRRRGDAAV